MPKSKFFRVAVEGATATDGRVIERNWIQEIAAGYNRDTYGARVNMEHIRGFSPQAPFNAYGDVLSVKAEEVTIELAGKQEKRLALFAEIDPTDELVKLTKARQKIYTSIEVQPNFAGTGKAGLVGLAVTDSPASLGTEILAFSAKPEAASLKAMLDSRKQDPGNVFSAAEETSIEIVDEAATETPLDKFLASITAMLQPKTPAADKPNEQQQLSQTAPADTAVLLTAMSEMGKGLADTLKADREATEGRFNKLTSEIAAIRQDVETTPAKHSSRPASVGGSGAALTDC